MNCEQLYRALKQAIYEVENEKHKNGVSTPTLRQMYNAVYAYEDGKEKKRAKAKDRR